MLKNIIIGALTVLSFIFALKLIQCRHALKLSQLEEAKSWSMYETCLDSDVQSRGAK